LTDSRDADLQARCEALGFAITQSRSAVPGLWMVMVCVSYMGFDAGLRWQPALFMACGIVSGLWRMRKLPDFDVPDDALLRVVVRAERHVQAAMLFSGVTWCFASTVMYPHFSVLHGFMFQFIVLSNVAAAAFLSSTIQHCFVLLAVPSLAPVFGWILYREHGGTAMLALLIPVYLLVMFRASQRLRAITLLAFRRGHEMAQTNLALRRAMDDAEAGVRAKTRFLATMSHELRTPLAGLLTALELVARDRLDPAQRRLVDVARGAGEGLLGVLNDVLDFAKIDADQMSLHARPTDLRGMTASVLDLFTASAEAKGLCLRSVLDPALPACVLVDAQRLRQVLINLVGNALKFTERGEVLLRLRRTPEGLRFEVQDTGIGIDPAVAAQLFQPFRQVHEDSDRQYGGTGLGLAISQRLVQAMGGTIDVVSQGGEGACFGFTLALPTAPAPAVVPVKEAATEATPPLALSGRVLVVEDNAVNRMLAVELLDTLQLQVQEAEDGVQALQQLPLGGIDLVLMDCQMPGIDGFEATRRWRAREQAEGRRRLPVLAVTASVEPEDLERVRAAGMDDVLGKPYTVTQLAQMLSRWLPSQALK
jgi:signal transduction histidine kinase/CheY-like chemotaxis protein